MGFKRKSTVRVYGTSRLESYIGIVSDFLWGYWSVFFGYASITKSLQCKVNIMYCSSGCLYQSLDISGLI